MSMVSCLAISNPFCMWYVSFWSGSYIIPFQPTVVRGFSKYVRITRSILSSTCLDNVFSFWAYSIAASVLSIEHGPVITMNRGSCCVKMFEMFFLPVYIVSSAFSVRGNWFLSSFGVSNFLRVSIMIGLLSCFISVSSV